MQDARNLIRYGGMRPDRDYLQFDCALSYGLVEYLRTLEMLAQGAWLVPEPLHSARWPSDVPEHRRGPRSWRQRVLSRPVWQPFGGFPDGVKVVNSYVTLPDLSGIGFEGKADLYREMKALSD